MNIFFSFIRTAIERLGSAPRIGGLQISDSGVQYVLLSAEGKAFSLRFAPGVVREGLIVDETAFVATLGELHTMIEPDRENQTIPIIVSLPAATVFTQTFNLPNVGRDRLEESANLNLQMLSPIPPEDAYMSWEEIEETEDRFEVLGAFTEKAFIDTTRTLFEKVGFAPVAFEFPSLGLTRVMTEAMGTMSHSAIGLEISSDGLDLFIMRHQSLHFDYFRSWHSIQGEGREIARSLFEDVVSQEVQRVTNFALSKFKEVVKDVYVIAPGFEEEMETLLSKKFGLRVTPVALPGWGLAPSWYATLGSALRGRMNRGKDKSISLAPFTAADLFQKERTLNFISLWRNLLAVTLFVFLLFYGSAALSLSRKSAKLQYELGEFRVAVQQQEMTALNTSIVEFNQLVQAVAVAKGTTPPWTTFFERLLAIAGAAHVAIDRLDVPSLAGTISLIARAQDEAGVLRFKGALTGDATIRDVELDISKITTLEDKSLSFPVSFQYVGQ